MVIHKKHQTSIPNPMARAPRVPPNQKMPSTSLYSGKSIDCDAVIAVISRDTEGVSLSEAQRLSHFPASSFVCLSWHSDIAIGAIEYQNNEVSWQPFDKNVLIAGSQSKPTTYWAPYNGRGGMMYFTISAAKELFNVDIASIQDQNICARQLLGASWFPMFDQLIEAKDDTTMLAIIKHHISSRWHSIHHTSNPVQNIQYAGRKWVEKLALQAQLWQNNRSLRQVQRSIKTMSGRSLREWQLLVSTEEIFFETAKDDQQILSHLNWADIAIEAGFADQAHLNRIIKRLTGFPPAEFARRFVEDESFWIYRLWI